MPLWKSLWEPGAKNDKLNRTQIFADNIIGILHSKPKVVYTLFILYFGSEV